MSFHRDRRERRRKRILPITICIMLIVVFLGLVPGARRLHTLLWKAGDGWHEIIAPAFASAKHLRREKEQLLERINFLQHQNDILRQTSLVTPVSDTLDPVVAHVVVQPHMATHRRYIIDRGARDGVSEGDRVFAGDIALGHIVHVAEKTSQVLPLFASNNTARVVHAATGESFVLEGRGGGVFYVEVPRATEIFEDDVMYWQESRGTALVGYVAGVEVSERDAVKKVHITMPVNPRTVQWVQVEVVSGK